MQGMWLNSGDWTNVFYRNGSLTKKSKKVIWLQIKRWRHNSWSKYFFYNQLLLSRSWLYHKLFRKNSSSWNIWFPLWNQNSGQRILMKACKDLRTALTDGSNSDVEVYNLYQELLILQTLIPQNIKKPADILKYLTKNGFKDNFLNFLKVHFLRIALHLPEYCFN